MTPTKPDISIIIPVLNESEVIPALLRHLDEARSGKFDLEIIVVDGGSTDGTVKIANNSGAKVITAPRGRAAQMNTGAHASLGGILYFLHADTLPPKDFDQKIMSAINPERLAGCFRMRFDHSHPMLLFFAWCSRINIRLCRGGDQSLFIDRQLFEECGGFNRKYRIYEDSELIGRLYQFTRFTIIEDYVVTSARKYRDLGIFTLQYHFGVIHLKNFLGAGPEQLYSYYNKKIAS